MPMCCCAIGCQNLYFSGCGRSFHQLPADPGVRQEWVARLTRADWCPTKSSVVCSDHFTADCFVGRAAPGFFVRRRLKPGAVPTVFSVEQMDNSRLHSRKIYCDLSWLDEVCITTGTDKMWALLRFCLWPGASYVSVHKLLVNQNAIYWRLWIWTGHHFRGRGKGSNGPKESNYVQEMTIVLLTEL